jgi:hypothetical protein
MKESAVSGRQQAIEWLREEAERDVPQRRYEGLSEMNPR